MDTRGLALLSPAGLEAILSRLPAEERAGIRWATGEIRSELRRLYEEEPTPDRIAEVSAVVVVRLRDLGQSVAVSTGEPAEDLAVDLDDLMRRELALLRAYIEPEAASAAEWAWRAAVRPLHAWVAEASVGETLGSEVHAWRDYAPTPSEVRDTPALGLLRAEFLLLAAFEGPHAHLAGARATELAYLAFEHACEGVDASAAEGVDLARYVADSPEARVSRMIRHADALRSALTAADMDALHGARLGDLR